MLEAPAFRALPGNAVKLLLILAKRFNGNNNGDISLSVREAAAEIGCSVNHALKCFRVLEREAFITTWRLTWLETNNPNALSGKDPGTKDFMRPRAHSEKI